MESLINAKRISIFGACGSGKSYLAKQLGEILNLPVHHIDCIYHKPGGEFETKEITTEKVNNITEQEKWIIDGNYRRSMENRFLLSDLIIFLNFSQEFCIKSVTDRQFKPNRIGLPEYYVETEQSLERLISFHIPKFQEMAKEHILPRIKQHKEKVIEFTNREQVNEFLEKLKKALEKTLGIAQ